MIAAYLLLCIFLGGSVQGVWGNLALQILGILLVGYSVLVPDRQPAFSPIPFVLLLVGITLVLLQLIPLPPELWTRLPGREAIAAGFDSLGYQRPSLPVSEMPYTTVMTLTSAIPAISIFLATLTLRPAPRWIALAIIASTMIAILLGAVQVVGGKGSWAYFYPFTNLGAVGFFANQNHMATLLLTAIPMIALTTLILKSDRRSAAARYGMGAALLVLLIAGIALNGSLAALALVIPVLLASLALIPVSLGWRRIILPAAMASFAAGIVLVAANPIGVGTIGSSASIAAGSREQIWKTTVTAIEDTFPVGTGLGTFEQVYRQYEDPAGVNAEYVNHAHNDYLELMLDLGLPGALLIVLFVCWWAVTAVKIWRSPLCPPVVRAATIATAAILAHSLVDFPLRTAAISAIFAALVAIMAEHSAAQTTTRDESRSGRHIKLG